MKNIFKYINFLLFIFLNNSSIAEIYSCIDNGNIIYTDKYKYSCSKAILPNLIIENNLHYNQNYTKKDNNLNKLSKSNIQSRYKILINELNNEKNALNKAKQMLLNNVSIKNKEKIFNEINDRKHNIYLLKKEISKIKE